MSEGRELEGREVDGRELKRARQACANCRRKKTRCSGERPSCSFCVHLKQKCEYLDTSVTSTGAIIGTHASPLSSAAALAGNLQERDANLAARVALLESRLNLVYSDRSNRSVSSDENSVTDYGLRTASAVPTENEMHPGANSSGVDSTSKFHSVPELRALRAAADVYFSNCHNQPYSYFHEASFRRRLEEGKLPDYLLLIFMATAARYSSDEFFEGRQFEAIEIYAKNAWRDILKQAFSSDVGLDLHTVQATNMLAVIDFTAGRHRLGWVKIGLAVRFAQGLRLNAEPDPNLPAWQQEEYRRVFWSVYLLDKLVSCCRNRPPTILDIDCTVRLPCKEEEFRKQSFEETPSIEILERLPDIAGYQNLDHFALLITSASILGRTMRYSLQQNISVIYPHWDSRSDYGKIYSVLLTFERIMTAGDDNLAHYIRTNFGTDSGTDRQRTGHFVWSRGLYHLAICLLHHPLLLRRCLQKYADNCPRSFLQEALNRCQAHADQLTAILRTVRETNCCAHGSFLGYFAVVAGTIHRLNEHSSDELTRVYAAQSSQDCLQFLDGQPACWENYPRMSIALRDFAINTKSAQALINPSTLLQNDEQLNLDNLWCILDYGWLSDASRSTNHSQATTLNIDSPSWGIFENLFADHILFPGSELNGHLDMPRNNIMPSMASLRQSDNKELWLNSPTESGLGFNADTSLLG